MIAIVPLAVKSPSISQLTINVHKVPVNLHEIVLEIWPSFSKISLERAFNEGKWRKRRDSNPRDGSPPTPLAGERLRPLGHVSANRFNYLFEQGQGLKLKIAKFLLVILITY
tara:strand:- start:91 stop:426 length:336 start_codon:yes stop_codon:yes gene_type:complete